MIILKKLPDVIGFYMPGDRRDDQDNLIPDKRTGELVPNPTMTKQAFADQCDINTIVREFTRTGMITHINERAAAGTFQDLPDSMDYQQALELARSGQAAFDQLPAKVRARFGNDPAQFLDFIHDPANQQEMIDLGLATDLRPPKAPESSPTAAPAPEGVSPPSPAK